MKKKLKLNDLKVQSFVTEISKKEDKNILGGAKSLNQCTQLSCGIVACTRDIIHCI